MRTVSYTNRCRRDYRREKSGQHGGKLDVLLMEIVDALAQIRLCHAVVSIMRGRRMERSS
jgi:hypothetical protein